MSCVVAKYIQYPSDSDNATELTNKVSKIHLVKANEFNLEEFIPYFTYTPEKELNYYILSSVQSGVDADTDFHLSIKDTTNSNQFITTIKELVDKDIKFVIILEYRNSKLLVGDYSKTKIKHLELQSQETNTKVSTQEITYKIDLEYHPIRDTNEYLGIEKLRMT